MGTAYNLLEAQIQKNLGNRTDADTASRILFNFNEAQRILAKAHEFEELKTTALPAMVVDQRVYTEAELGLTTPKLIYSIRVLQNERNTLVKFVGENMWDEEIAPALPTVTSSWPSFYTKWSTDYEFNRAADDTYTLTIKYYKWPTIIAAVGAVTTITFENIDLVLTAMTSYLVFMSLEEEEPAMIWKRIASEYLSQHGLDARKILNFSPYRRTGAFMHDTAKPWTDPFNKGRR